MLGPYNSARQRSTRRPRRFVRQVLVLFLLSTSSLLSQPPQKSAAPVPAASAEVRPGQEKPQAKPDESAAATAALV